MSRVDAKKEMSEGEHWQGKIEKVEQNFSIKKCSLKCCASAAVAGA
jgi:hypothetical protein